MYVVNIRLAVIKDFDPNYFCNQRFIDEFHRYRRRLDRWIDELNTLIGRSHAAGVTVRYRRVPPPELYEITGWTGTHTRGGVVVFQRQVNGPSFAARDRLQQQVEASRSAGIAEDRREFGVVDMERTLAAWQNTFDTNRRAALVRQVLHRQPIASDFSPAGPLVDGRRLAPELDLRTTLRELLLGREFQLRIESSWRDFAHSGGDRLARFAVRHLLGRDASTDEVSLLRDVARRFGYGAFVAALLHGAEYEQRNGSGLPTGGPSLTELIEPPEPSPSATETVESGPAMEYGGESISRDEREAIGAG